MKALALSKGAEFCPAMIDDAGRMAFAPVRFFSAESARRYAEEAAKLSGDDARSATWPKIAQMREARYSRR